MKITKGSKVVCIPHMFDISDEVWTVKDVDENKILTFEENSHRMQINSFRLATQKEITEGKRDEKF